MFQQGAFTNSANATPEQIARKREMIAALMPRFGQAKYIGEGIGQLAYGIGAGLAAKKLDQQEQAGRDAYNGQFDAALGAIRGTAQPGAFTVLGSAPSGPNEAIAADTMQALGKGGTMQPDAVVQGLVQRGMPEHIAQGFATNFKDESGFNTAAVGDNGNAFGLAQWNGPRKAALEQYAASMGKPASDMNVQLDFLMTELQGPEAAAWSKISGAPDAGSAAAAVLNHFERPAEEHRARREAAYTGGAPMAGPQGAAAAVPIEQLYALMSDPWASPEQKAVVGQMIEQQTKLMDPAYQMGIEKQRLELDAMRNPAPPKPIEVGGVLVDPNTYQPLFDARQPDAGTTVNVNNIPGAPGPGADEEAVRGALGKKEGEAWSAYIDAGSTSAGTMQDMQLLDQLITMAPQGPIEGRLAQAFPGVSSAADAFQSVVKRVAPTLRAPGSGATSDIEYDGMLKSLPQLSSRPEANAAISGMMKAKAQINVERAEAVRAYQNGELSLADTRRKISEIESRSIMTPELKALLDATGPAPQGDAPDGVDQEIWDEMTPEERAAFQ